MINITEENLEQFINFQPKKLFQIRELMQRTYSLTGNETKVFVYYCLGLTKSEIINKTTLNIHSYSYAVRNINTALSIGLNGTRAEKIRKMRSAAIKLYNEKYH